MNSGNSYDISNDPARLDMDLIHGFLDGSYWAKGIPREVVERSLKNSLCFGVYCEGKQMGFARVITDYATFAYVADVFVAPEHRGKGVSKHLMKAILAHPDLQGLRRVLLVTRDAQGLYSQFGFSPLAQPEQYMTIHHPDIYQKPA
jgi:N-acetylglutamate synthase-like GNAT family acetyltransferase